MVATLNGFPFRWELGEEKLSVVSIGTGYSIFKKQAGEIEDAWVKTWALNVPNMLMQDASWQNQIMLQWLSNSPTAQYIDMEMEDLGADLIAGHPLIKYLRYNLPITENDLNGLGLDRNFTQDDVASLIEMSNSENKELLYEMGVAGSSKVLASHFS